MLFLYFMFKDSAVRIMAFQENKTAAYVIMSEITSS